MPPAHLLPALLLLLHLLPPAPAQDCPATLPGPPPAAVPPAAEQATVPASLSPRRLLGGSASDRSALRYLALFRAPNGDLHKCTATILDFRWLLTAASCDITPSFTASYGLFQERQLKIADVFPAPNGIDAALVKLDVPVDELELSSARVNDDPAAPSPGAQARAVAYNVIDAAKGVGKFEHVEVPVRPRGDCEAADYGNALDFDDATMICAGSDKCDYCDGDAGGPLLQFDTSPKQRPVLVGVISTSNSCGAKGRPGVYTRVSALGDFLRRKREEEGAVFTTIDADADVAQVKASPSPSASATPSATPTVTPTPSATAAGSAAPAAQAGDELEVSDDVLRGESGGNGALWFLLVIGLVAVVIGAGTWWRYRFARE